MWAVLGLFSAFFLGIYDIFKKLSLNHNAVLPVLFFSTLTGAVLFLPVGIGSYTAPGLMKSIGLYAPPLSFAQHLQALLKSVIVVSSWILAFFAMKHLPVTVFSPIRATGPFWTLVGAIVIFGEKLNLFQWIGVLLTLLFFWLFSTTGKHDGIQFRKNRWIWLIVVSTVLSAISGLYDKYIISHIDRIAVQVWFSYYQVVVMLPVMALAWYPNRGNTTPFQWRWTIPLIGICLVVADFIYFSALTYDGAMISMISALRRGSVIITFTVGAIIFGEKNLKFKTLYLLGILAGIVLITLGSR